MKMLKMLFGIFISMTGNIEAASFDCGKAKTRIEKMICSDDELSTKDENMSRRYFEILKKMDSQMKKNFINDHKRWLKKVRNACSNTECLKMVYTERISDLILTLSTECAGNCSGFVVSVPGNNPVSSEETEDMENMVDENEWEGDVGYLEMTCDYSGYDSFEIESVSVKRAVSENEKPDGVPPCIKVFKPGKNNKDNVKFILEPGQFAECIFPSGNRVRAKVGRGVPRPHGDCGADPEVFLSLWVNKRKIASAEWFAAHCIDNRGDVPDLSYDMSSVFGGIRVQKCHTAREPVDFTSDESKPPKEKPTVPVQVCIDYPDISKYPVDTLEYPPPGIKVSKAGDIEIVYGSGALANVVRDELRKKNNYFSQEGDTSKVFKYPVWKESTKKLPGDLSDCEESVFDFNNDGKLDRVFRKSFSSHYMDGSVLLVQAGNSASKLIVPPSAMDKTSIYLPYHLDGKRKNIDVYPPFSQDNDEANFLMSVDEKGKKYEVEFRSRYIYVTPFIYHGTTYIIILSPYEDSQNHVAVLKPMPDGKFQNICLIRKVHENF